MTFSSRRGGGAPGPGMGCAFSMGMSTANVLLVVMSAAVSVTAIAILHSEYQPALRELRAKAQLTQTGDSSLSPQSVNWLAAVAVAAALVIGLVVM